MLSNTKFKPVTAAAVRAMLEDGKELALIDLREELIFSQNHLLWARNVPLSRLELRFARLVPRKATRIVLIDDNDGLVQRAAAILSRSGYSDISYLDGGTAAWEQAGFVTFSGVHVPSKAFGEFVEHDSGTPSVSAQELDAMMHDGTKLVVLDSRPFDEYTRISIPTGINVPGAELVLRARDIARSPDTTIVVNCAGRTRSIIGAQSLINAGIPNKVVALRNGTMGWHLAGLTCASGKADRAPQFSNEGLAWAKQAAEGVAKKYGVARIDRAAVETWRKDTTRTTYVFDVRDPAEYKAGHLPGAISAPGGQLVQATDHLCRRARRPRRRQRRPGSARADERIVAQADGLAGRVRAWRKPATRRPSRRPSCSARRMPITRSTLGGDRVRRCVGDRSLEQPALPARPYSRRLVRHPLAARPRAREDRAHAAM